MNANLLAGVFAMAAVAWGQSAKTWSPPRMADGQPDLQGVWSTATTTPLERPAELAGKTTLSAAEAAEFQKKAIYDVDGDRRDGGGAADVGRAYNEFWRERGQVVPDLRTSLIVDPPDGRVPALTAEGRDRIAARESASRTRVSANPWEDYPAWTRCITRGVIKIGSFYSSSHQITQSPGYVVISQELI